MPETKRTILVTGGTSGLGYHATTNLARQHPDNTIIIASRSDSNSAASSIRQLTGHQDVHFLPLDLGNLQNIRSFAIAISERGTPPISILLLNAAMQFPDGIKYTIDGFEATFGINHVGHALLFHLLRSFLADKARVVVTGSASHDPAQKTGVPDANYTSAEELAHPVGEAVKNTGMQRYATSKLCNVIWSYALHRRFASIPGKQWTVVVFDSGMMPGMMPGTGLAREAGPVFKFVWHRVLPRLVPFLRRVLSFSVWTAQESGSNLAWVPSEESTSGVYYDARTQIKSISLLLLGSMFLAAASVSHHAG
ncbi:uncharacterized protein N0V89_010124 [Didymosphaeria variabile]|uniref:NAD(P)-binding protein n=1 Tax=Didymosphaeria variabile TaxID=1932322 RepID=A0A9W9C802_9PLEO|nr:uncharacterized protein N0V89_010124 [Didymosphaeria variabile]KAJ4348746.1 hypothetical protein N0V89_010124 [Didymosphaeria variabile]